MYQKLLFLLVPFLFVASANSNIMSHPQFKSYEKYCSSCHSDASVGAPVLGDKVAWQTRLDDGIDRIYAKGINGMEGGMPPKGGVHISDKEFKKIVDFMIEASINR